MNTRNKLFLMMVLEIAIWGLAFEPRTDDVRDAPAIDLLERLLAGGAHVSVYDPEALVEPLRQVRTYL